jgi:hypothetical protein
MSVTLHRWALSLVLILVLPLSAQGRFENATVTGRVVDRNDRPVEGAQISIFPMDVPVSGSLPSAVTGPDGRYTLSSPPYRGRTRFCAVKENAGYPDSQGLLFTSDNDNMPEVSLAPGAHLVVDIHLGDPDGILEGSVVDARTGAPISKARVTLHRDQPESMYSATVPPSGRFLFPLPPVPISLSISAPGYRPWKYRDPVSGVTTLALGTADHKILRIELQPQ